MNSKTIRATLLVITFAFTIVPIKAAVDGSSPSRPSVRSADAYKVEIDRLLQAQNFRGTMVKSIKAFLGPLAAQDKITSLQLNAIAEEVADVSYPQLKMATGQCLQQNLTLGDLRQINAFYATPAGKKINDLAPTLMDIGAKTMQNPEVLVQIQKILQKHLGK